MNQSWETVVTVALLGTDRQSTLPAMTENSIKPLIDQIDGTDAEGWLLSVAGTLAVYQQAGQQLEKRSQPLTEAAEIEASVQDETASLSFLQMIFTQNFQPVLPEFLSLLQQAGQHIPPEFLPQLLDWGYAHPEVQEPLRAVIGPRGNWLALLNPKWRYAQATPHASDPEEWQALWETSDRTVRLNLLREWRLQNPDTARELLATTWKQESARDRTAFLDCLDLGLSLADEEFLEAGLEDRSKEVQSKAIGLLSKLPESRQSQQLGAQVKELISLKEFQKHKKLEITLPTLEDPQWQKYGLNLSRFKQDQQGNRAALLSRTIGLAPLSIWEEFGSPRELLSTLAKQKWKQELAQGWLTAAQNQQDLNWSIALLDWATTNLLNHSGRWMLPLNPFRQLLSNLPEVIKHQWIESILNSEFWQGDLVEILISNTSILPLQLSHTVLSTAQQSLTNTSEEKQTRAIANKLQYLSNSLDPDVLSESSTGSFQMTYHRLQTDDFSRLWEFLRLRQQMRQTILEKADPSE